MVGKKGKEKDLGVCLLRKHKKDHEKKKNKETKIIIIIINEWKIIILSKIESRIYNLMWDVL